MTENEKPNSEFLMAWLIFVNLCSAALLYFLVSSLTKSWIWLPSWNRMRFLYLFLVIAIPALSVLAWKYFLNGNKKLSAIFSIILFLLFFLFLLIWVYIMFFFISQD